MKLASYIVSLIAGPEAAEQAKKMTTILFWQGDILELVKWLSADDIRALNSETGGSTRDGSDISAVSYTHLDVYKRQDYVDPLDIDVNYYRIDFKNADVIYIPWNEFMILRDPTFKDRLAFEIVGPPVTTYTGRPVSHIRTITCLLYTSRCV